MTTGLAVSVQVRLVRHAQTQLGPDAPFYRAVISRWAHLPKSDAGAAVVDGPASQQRATYSSLLR
jgi:hypothetical protein